MEVLHRYTARDSDEMDLQESDIVEVYRKMDDGGSTTFENENEIENESEARMDGVTLWKCNYKSAYIFLRGSRYWKSPNVIVIKQFWIELYFEH